MQHTQERTLYPRHYEPLPTRADLEHLGELLGMSLTWEQRIEGGQSATTDVLRDDLGRGVVLRRHGRWTNHVDDDTAGREHAVFGLARDAGIPTPRVLWTGPFGPSTAIVTELIDGDVVLEHYDAVDRLEWARQLATTLVDIHQVVVDPRLAARIDAVPSPFTDDLGEALDVSCDVRRLLDARAAFPAVPDTECLIHGDYWPGNVLWRNGSIVGVLDWEQTTMGDPAKDVAYCSTELRLLGHDAAADHFVATYRDRTGATLTTLDHWIVATLCYATVGLDSYLASWRGFGRSECPDTVRVRLQHLVSAY